MVTGQLTILMCFAFNDKLVKATLTVILCVCVGGGGPYSKLIYMKNKQYKHVFFIWNAIDIVQHSP